jgi:hypothetical protein
LSEEKRAYMSRRAKVALSIAGVVVVAIGIFFLLLNRDDIPVLGDLVEDDPAICPLTGLEPRREQAAERPAVAVKVTNSSAAYPLSGLDRAELVYEEPVEGGGTRFMAVYHCTDTPLAGPVRSARSIDPAVMTPISGILAFSGANKTVLADLDAAGVVQVQENGAEGALQRVPREGYAFEHTLYAQTSALRRIGREGYDEPPPEDILSFGKLEAKGRMASTIAIDFGGSGTVSYEWAGEQWLRSQNGVPFEIEGSGQLGVENVLIEEHVVNHSTITDVAGNPSVEIADVTGNGRAVLFRNGRRIAGRWKRETEKSEVVFERKAGGEMVFAPGSIWVHLVPNNEGDVKGSFTHAK